MKKMSSNQLTPEQKAEIETLLALPDEEIDTQDIPEVVDWSGMQRGLFYRPIEQQSTLRHITAEENPLILSVLRHIELTFVILSALFGICYFIVAYLITHNPDLLTYGEPATIVISSLAGLGSYFSHKNYHTDP